MTKPGRKIRSSTRKTARAIGGATAKKNGKVTEELVENLNTIYSELGISFRLRKNYEPYIRCGFVRGGFKAVYKGEAEPDFSIWLNNLAGYIEVKGRDNHRIRKDCVDVHQMTQLLESQLQGHLGLILCKIQDKLSGLSKWFLCDAFQWNGSDGISFTGDEIIKKKIGVECNLVPGTESPHILESLNKLYPSLNYNYLPKVVKNDD